MRLLKSFIITVPLALGAVSGGYVWHARQTSAAIIANATTNLPVTRGSIIQSVAATGQVVSNLDVDIKCKASGEITVLPYSDVSLAVHKGDLLTQLDPITEQRAVDQATVALTQSQAKLAEAQETLSIAQQTLTTAKERADATEQAAAAQATDAQTKADRRKELFDQKLSSQEDYDTAVTAAKQAQANLDTAKVAIEELKQQEESLELKSQDVTLAEAQVKSDQINLDDANQNLTDTKVIAPMDGVISAIDVQKGQIISSGITNVGGGTTIMTLSDLSHIFVLATVDESDIGRVAANQTVKVTADAFPGQTFQGKVVRVATKGVNVSNVVTFEVKIEITSDNKSLLKPAMTANVEIITASRTNVLTVPVDALTRKGGNFYATEAGLGGVNSDKLVTVGLTDGQKYEVTGGLNEGDTLVLKKADPQSKWRADPTTKPASAGAAMLPGGGGKR
jgi:multidrug resistance efflux pump